MAFSHGVVSYFAAIMFVVVFFFDGEYQVNGSEIFLANVGENITLNCTGRSEGITYWYRNKEGHKSNEYIAAVEPLTNQSYLYDDYDYVDKSHFSQQHEVNSSEYRSFTLGVYDVNINDSANYTCNFNKSSPKTYDVRIIECTDCQFHPFSRSKKTVDCGLNNFHGSHLAHKVYVMVNNKKNNTALIEKDTLSFTISNARLYSGFSIEFNPYPELRNIGSNISCIIPPQPSTYPTSTASTMVITTHPRTSEKSLSPSTHPTPSPTTTSSIISTRKYDQVSTLAIRWSSPSGSDTPFTSLKGNTSDKSNVMTINKTFPIFASIGSFVLVVLIVIFVIIRCKQTKRRHKKKSYQSDTNGPSADKAPPGERDYESIEEVSQAQPCELVDNILYESSDGVIAGSASTSDDQADTVLYTVPDKTGIIKRVAVSKMIRDPSDLMNPHCNKAMIPHHEPTESKQEQENQYENVAMAGKGRDDDIPLYAMPNKGPMSAKNNPKCRPGTESHEDDDAEIPLYDTPD